MKYTQKRYIANIPDFMKYFYTLGCLLLTFSFVQAQNEPFVTTWVVGTEYGLDIEIPTEGGGYNYTVDFGDGTILTNQTDDAEHTYVTPGIYTVSITGDFPRISFANSYYIRFKIKSIEQWGDIEWQSMEYAFSGCENLEINAIDQPDLSNVTSTKGMFYGAESLDQSIDNWDVSSITDMSRMFYGCENFNQPLNNWNVSNVTDMSSMFEKAENFNQPLNNWSVSNVVDMSAMFSEAFKFNQSLNSWNVLNVTNMYSTFRDAINFNQNLNDWNVSSVTNMQSMFEKAIKFNQPLNNWNVGNVQNFHRMFQDALSFNKDLENWNTTNATNFNSMFSNAISFNGDISDWDVSNVTSSSNMFYGAVSFNQPLGNWDVSNIISISGMFNNANIFNQDLSTWNFNSAAYLNDFIKQSNMNASNYDALLNQFVNLNLQNKTLESYNLMYCDENVRANLINNLGWTINGDAHIINCNITLPPGAFVFLLEANENIQSISIYTDNSYNYNFNVDFGDGTILTNITGDYTHTYSTEGVYQVSITGSYPHLYVGSDRLKSVEQWGNNQWLSMENMFSESIFMRLNASDNPNLNQVLSTRNMFQNNQFMNADLNNWDVSNIVDMSNMFKGALRFNQALDNWDVSNVQDMSGLFQETRYFNQPLNNWNVSNVENMENLFYGGEFSNSSFNQPLDNWNVSNATNMKNMFRNSPFFNQSINSWDVSNVTNMEAMFSSNPDWSDFGSIVELHSSLFNQPLNNWNVSSVVNMSKMFKENYKFNQPLNDWDVSNVENMVSMFEKCLSFNQPLDDWDVSNVVFFVTTFREASSFNQNIDSWNISSATNLSGMFWGATEFNQPLNSWDTSPVTGMEEMFFGALKFNRPLNNWDVSGVVNMEGMFCDAESFDQDLSSWNFPESVSFNSIFDNSFVDNTSLSTFHYDQLLERFWELGLEDKELKSTGLNYCNEFVRGILINDLNWEITEDTQATECGNFNLLNGAVVFDEDLDGCDNDDVVYISSLVNISNGTNSYGLSISEDGEYDIFLDEGSFNISLMNLPSYLNASPNISNVNFTGSGNQDELDFCITANQTVEDLNVTLLPTSEARPGFEANYQLVIENMGTQTVNNITVNLNFDDAKQNFVTSSPSPASSTANQLSYTVTSLQPFAKEFVDVTMQTFQPPIVNGDDLLNFTATVTSDANDYTPNDNTYNLDQNVVNSYDPNDKTVLQGSQVLIDDADEYLDYLIRFQNTGTASAINVRITDTLHPKLDWNTIKPISSSHDYHVEITKGNEVEFIFEDINLPHEAANAPGSNGFIAYKIKPKSDVVVGDIVSGDAAIYFDFNAPIITNMVATEFVEELSTTDFSIDKQLKIYPNPASSVLHIQTTNTIEIEQASIYNLQGRELLQFKNSFENLNIENLSNGIYLLKIRTNRGELVKKLIKN